MNFEDTTAITTGAAAGLGKQIALQMSQAGAKVAIMDSACGKIYGFRKTLVS